jgi:hypothetical protein
MLGCEPGRVGSELEGVTSSQSVVGHKNIGTQHLPHSTDTFSCHKSSEVLAGNVRL